MDIGKLKARISCEKKYIFVAVILWVLISYSMYLAFREEWSQARIQPKYIDTFSSHSDGEKQSVLLTNDAVFSQIIKIEAEEISGLSLHFDAEKQPEEGIVSVQLFEQGGDKILASWQRDAKEIPLGTNCDFVLSEMVPLEEHGKYVIRVSARDFSEASLNLILSRATQEQEIEMSVNGEVSEYAMEYRIIKGNYNILRFLAVAFYIGMTIAIFAVAFLLVNQVKLEWVFVVFVLVIGGMYLFALPPYTVPDEASHFVTTYAHSSKLLGEKVVDDEGKVIVENEKLWGASESYPSRKSYDTYLRGALGLGEDSDGETISTRTPLEMRHPGYLPHVLGVSLARILSFNSEQILLAGRVFSLIWYVFIMYWAIKLIPFGKMALFVIGTLPMTMQMVVSYNYDSVLLGVCFFVVAYLLNLVYRRESVRSKDLLILSALGITIASIKFIYLPLIGLALFIPKEKFKTNRNKIVSGVIVLGISVITLLYLKLSLVNNMMTPHAVNSADFGEAITIGSFLQNPKRMFDIFYRTFEHQTSFYVSSMIASPLGWLEIWLPDIIVFAFLFILLFSVICNNGEKEEVSKCMRNFSCVIASGMMFLALAALLFDCTDVEARQIVGFQGRYFLPIITLMIIILRNNVILLRRNIDKYLILLLSYLHCSTIFYISLIVIGR